jgi:hypothetical protein
MSKEKKSAEEQIADEANRKALNPSFDFARKSTATPGFPAKSITAFPKIILQPQPIRDSSRPTSEFGFFAANSAHSVSLGA